MQAYPFAKISFGVLMPRPRYRSMRPYDLKSMSVAGAEEGL